MTGIDIASTASAGTGSADDGGAVSQRPFREARVNLAAITANVRSLRRTVGTAHTMAVVKADGYGHGAVQVALAALAGGADWIGVADLGEALRLREAGIDAPLLAWLHGLGTDFAPAIAAGIDIGVSSTRHLAGIADGIRAIRSKSAEPAEPAFVQLKLETGLNRNGASEPDWAGLFATARRLELEQLIRVRGVFSHLSNASPADDARAITVFERGVAAARAAGLSPELIHLASTAAAIRIPRARFDMVRLGIGIYGLSPFGDQSSADLGLTPALTLRARVAAVRHAVAGSGVSYDYAYRTAKDTTLVLVPLGYADGVPRQASNRGPVSINGKRYTVAGRIAMDQFVVDVGAAPVAVGDEVVLFGDPTEGVPSADDWARAAGTINYEIVARLGARPPRSYSPSAG
ncbi:MAG: alanine racemase [Microbacteriaceae bacterium]